MQMELFIFRCELTGETIHIQDKYYDNALKRIQRKGWVVRVVNSLEGGYNAYRSQTARILLNEFTPEEIKIMSHFEREEYYRDIMDDILQPN